MQITYKQLEKARACDPQLDEFKRRFGDAVEVTEELCLSVAPVFDWGWAADNLLAFASRKAYDEAVAPAVKAYDEARAVAFARAYNSEG